jgi:hypothetical protein
MSLAHAWVRAWVWVLVWAHAGELSEAVLSTAAAAAAVHRERQHVEHARDQLHCLEQRRLHLSADAHHLAAAARPRAWPMPLCIARSGPHLKPRWCSRLPHSLLYASEVPAQMWQGVGAVPAQVWALGEPSPGADLGTGERGPGADVAGAAYQVLCS